MSDEPDRIMPRLELPIRLGFFLEKPGTHCWAWSEVQYRGVDRMYFTPTADELDSYRSSGRERLAALWDRYSQAEDSDDLHIDRNLALELRAEFMNDGLELDVIYVEIASLPDRISPSHGAPSPDYLRWALHVHERIDERQADLAFMGFDVSDPAPTFHSAIAEPGLHESRPELASRLNANGLLNDLTNARGYMDDANRTSKGRVFCVLGVWDVAT